MRTQLPFLLLALVLHLILFLVMPQVFNMPERRIMTVVSFEPVERTVAQADTVTETPAPRAEPATAEPAQPKPQTQEKPEPTPKPAEPKPTVTAPAPTPEPAEPEPVTTPTEPTPQTEEPAPVPDEPKPVEISTAPTEELPEEGEETFSKPDENSPEIAGEHTGLNSSGPETAVSEDNSSAVADAAPPAEEIPDGRVELQTVQTSVGDRIDYSLSITGTEKGRQFRGNQPPGNFRSSNNMDLTVRFKIDKNGVAYDPEIPPAASGDIDIMLRDFIRNMRFTAVLYSEPDLAEIKVTLKVR